MWWALSMQGFDRALRILAGDADPLVVPLQHQLLFEVLPPVARRARMVARNERSTIDGGRFTCV
jgi:hypothetical protein